MSVKSWAEQVEERRAGRAAPFCPVCGAGNLSGEWEGPLGVHERATERGEWLWACNSCGESGPWMPALSHSQRRGWLDPFSEGRTLYDPDA